MIVTFYSFKGGVGRSMAMANIGRWLQLQGLNVVMVDWDLEAPGLETFFASDEAQLRDWRRRVGLSDLVSLYKHDFPTLALENATRPDAAARLDRVLAPLRSVLIDIPAPTEAVNTDGPTPGKLRLLSAGVREGAQNFAAYANEVQSIDWNDFYASYRGRDYFDWMRASLKDPSLADIVLIDSRTGVTEMGGVCTRQMADVIVVLAAPNRQNVEGAAQIAETFNRADVVEERGDRRVSVIMVPSRVEVQSTEIKIAFERYFREHATAFMPDELAQLSADFWELRIPQISQYSYRERLAIGAPDGDPDLVNAYKAIAANVAWLAPLQSRVRQAMRPEFRRVFGEERVRALLDIDAEFERALSEIAPEMRPPVRELLLRFVQLRARPHDADGSRTWLREPLQATLGPAIDAALRVDLIRSESKDGEVVLQLADPRLVTHSTVLSKWIEADRPFLTWRQRLRGYLEDWQGVRKDAGALLQGTLLNEAKALLQASGGSLLPDEESFIRQSIEHDEMRLQREREAEQAATRVQAILRTPAPAAVAVQPSRSMTMTWMTVAAAVVALTAWWSFSKTTASNSAVSAVDSLVHAARNQASGSNFAAAESLYAQALGIDSTSVEVLQERAAMRMQLRDYQGAIADLDGALRFDSTSIALFKLRAEARANTSDLAGALADLQRVPSDSLSSSELRERADLSYSQGRDTLALSDYTLLTRKGLVADGELGRARVFEALGRKDSAIAAYKKAIPTITNSTQRTVAEAALLKLSPKAPIPEAIQPVIRLELQSEDDASVADILEKTLSRYGLRLARGAGRKLFTISDSSSVGGAVKYFFPEDAELANRTNLAVTDAVTAVGSYRRVDTVFVKASDANRKRRRGEIDIVLPQIQRPYKK